MALTENEVWKHDIHEKSYFNALISIIFKVSLTNCGEAIYIKELLKNL